MAIGRWRCARRALLVLLLWPASAGAQSAAARAAHEAGRREFAFRNDGVTKPAFAQASFEEQVPLVFTSAANAVLPATVTRRCGSRLGERPAGELDLPYAPDLGGDYWTMPVPAISSVGQDGSCWLAVPADVLREGILSPMFGGRPGDYLSFRVRGASRHDLQLELRLGAQVVATQGAIVRNGSPGMARVFIRLPRESGLIKLLIRSTLGSGEVELDDFQLSKATPPVMDGRKTPLPKPAALYGVADTHVHLASWLAFGGPFYEGTQARSGVIHGEVDGPPERALRACDGRHTDGDVRHTTFWNNTEPGHSVSGWPDFKDWPRHNTTVHQQLYIDWVRRAWQGGLRLMVAAAVNNETLARLFGPEGREIERRNDMESVRVQLAEIVALVNRHRDFMGLAYSPAQARDLIAHGKLAVVLGAEVDSIGSCHETESVLLEHFCAYTGAGSPECVRAMPPHPCTRATTDAALDELQRLGLRHIFPIHHTDNDFGGTALYNNDLHFHQFHVRHAIWRPEQVGPGRGELVGYWVGAGFDVVKQFLANIDFPSNLGNPLGPHVNSRGLSALGAYAVQQMLRRGMVVDVDHMSEKARRCAYEIASGQSVAAGHTWFRELRFTSARCGTVCALPGVPESCKRCVVHEQTDDLGKLANENDKMPWDLQTLSRLRGVVGVGSGPVDGPAAPDAGVPNDCSGSTRSWLQGYLYASAALRGGGLTLGTDMALQGQLLPRFGTWACLGKKHGGHVFHVDDGKRADPGQTLSQTLRANADAQLAGVTYRDRPRSYHTKRFSRPGGGLCFSGPVPRQCGETSEPYDARERAAWQAIAMYEAGVRTTDAILRADLSAAHDWAHDTDRAKHFAIGLGATSEPPDRSGSLYVGWGEERAAYFARTGRTPGPNENSDVVYLYRLFKGVWDRWQAMVAGGNPGAPLTRSTIGNREFDFNLDGLAHYGMIPDMLQDASNQLRHYRADRPDHDLRRLFGGAEAYIRMWERIEAARSQVPTDTPACVTP